MSFMARIDTLDPRTVADIRKHTPCGCVPGMRRDARWSICDYHEGYEAALEMHASGPDPLPEGLQ
jgi:hypothetical protein